MSKLTLAQSRNPKFYAGYNPNSVMYALLKAITSQDEIREPIIDRVYNNININTTAGEDLETRWGNLLSCPRKADESYELYRGRLRTVYPALIGGTAEAIKYAAAAVLNVDITNHELVDFTIQVYDGWEFDSKNLGYGTIVVHVNSMMVPFDDLDFATSEIEKAVNNVKAAGIKPYILYERFNPEIYKHFDYNLYIGLNDYSYDELTLEDRQRIAELFRNSGFSSNALGGSQAGFN